MKRLLLLLVIVFALLAVCAWIFFPSRVKLDETEGFSCTTREFTRCLHDTAKWAHWIPDSAINSKTINEKQEFTVNGVLFRMARRLSNGADFDIVYRGNTYSARMEAISLRPDSLLVSFQTELATNGRFDQRFSLLSQERNIRSAMKELLERLGSFTAKPVNIYGFDIARTGFDDTLLLAVKKTSASYPGTEQVYDMVHDLQAYMAAHGAKETDYPMYHVIQQDSSHFTTMVAIATDRMLPEQAPYFMIRMVHLNGKYVRADVRGGPATIKHAHQQINSFMIDHSLTAPAIPFEIMITNRSQQPDTSKWITRVYHPST